MAKKKPCYITENNVKIDYKNVPLMIQFLTRYGKIKPRYYTGTTLQNQKKLSQAIKRARYMALVRFVR